LVAFPLSNQVGSKKRPAVVVSSQAYNWQRLDVIVMAVTSQVRQPSAFGEIVVQDWPGDRFGTIRPPRGWKR